MTRLAVVALVGFCLAGCTTASTMMLSANTAQVSAKDLNTGSRFQVRKKALMTAALEAQARGYEYFGVVSLNERSTQDSLSTHSARSGPGGEMGMGVPIRDLYADVTVRFLHASDLPADRDGIYSAVEVSQGKLPLTD